MYNDTPASLVQGSRPGSAMLDVASNGYPPSVSPNPPPASPKEKRHIIITVGGNPYISLILIYVSIHIFSTSQHIAGDSYLKLFLIYINHYYFESETTFIDVIKI